MNSVTIVIPTYNRSKFLKETIDSLISKFETQIISSNSNILVINNNSTDDTENVLKEFRQLNYIRILKETKQGLSNAKNRGLKEASKDYVIFIDDDLDFSDGWFLEIQKNIDVGDIAICGGPVLPYSKIPNWIPNRFHYLLSVSGKELEKDGFVNDLMGGNSIVKREVVINLGGFDPKLGRNGKLLMGNEENELFERIRKNGLKLFCNSKAIVYHKIEDKYNLDYLNKFSRSNSMSNARNLVKHNLLMFIIKSIISIIRLIIPPGKDQIERQLFKSSSIGYLMFYKNIFK